MVHKLLPKAITALRSLVTRSVHIECDRIPYDHDAVPLKKLLNWILVEASVHAKPEIPWGWPTHLQVEPSALCNIDCKFCPVATGMDRPSGLMDPAIFRRVIDDMATTCS